MNISDELVKGATLFGVAATLLGLAIIIEEKIIKILFLAATLFYLILSILAYNQNINRQRKQ